MRGEKRNSKKGNGVIFISAIIALFVISIIGFNYDSFGDLTAGAIKFGKTSIAVNPKFIDAGDEITIIINPGRGCVNRAIGIYDESNLRRATTQYRGGTQIKVCEPFTARYKTSTSWKPGDGESGVFFVKTFDYGTEEFITTAFTIRGD